MGLRIVSFKVDDDLLASVDLIGVFLGRNRSEVIRDALEKYVREFFREHEGVRRRVVVVDMVPIKMRKRFGARVRVEPQSRSLVPVRKRVVMLG